MQKVSPEALTYSRGRKSSFASFPNRPHPRPAKRTHGSSRAERLFPGLPHAIFSEAVARKFRPEKIILFGSYASGTGEIKIGEGVMSLRRAFRIAGAETVLASHWKVSDQATSQLMTEFVRRWRSGKPRAQAWREAQLSLLHSQEFSNPFFWAAFILTGQWR